LPHAILHDTIEDDLSNNIVPHLIRDKFGERVLALVQIVTRNEDVRYFDYIRSLKPTESAPIKIADLTDYLDHRATLRPSQVYRYTTALAILKG